MAYTIYKIQFTEYDGRKIEYIPNNPIVRSGKKNNVADKMCRDKEIRRRLSEMYGEDIVPIRAKLIIKKQKQVYGN